MELYDQCSWQGEGAASSKAADTENDLQLPSPPALYHPSDVLIVLDSFFLTRGSGTTHAKVQEVFYHPGLDISPFV
jgi:hypothetical protein